MHRWFVAAMATVFAALALAWGTTGGAMAEGVRKEPIKDFHGGKKPKPRPSPLSCHVEGATKTKSGTNIFVRNKTAGTIAAGQTIAWTTKPEQHSGTFVLTTPITPHGSLFVGKAFALTCEASILH